MKDWRNDVTGQRELVAWRKLVYVPIGDIDDPAVRAVTIDQSDTALEAERLARQRERALQQSAARAKRTCRQKIKSAQFASLLTCTYRENMQDFDKVRADWHSMLRKLQRVIPGFQAVYSFERQVRGAWHVHAAIEKLPPFLMVPEGAGSKRLVRVRSWDYVRRLWRSIVGLDNGNIDIDGHRRTRHGMMGKYRPGESLAKLAGYVSKYLTKDYADGLSGRKRWGSTQGCKAPKAITYIIPECPFHELIEMAFHVPDGHRIVRHRIAPFGRIWMLYTEPGEPDVPLLSDF